MADIRKRTGAKGTTYQVRYPDTASKTGYSYKTFETLKEARAFRESGEAKKAEEGARARRHPQLSPTVSGNGWRFARRKAGTAAMPITAFTLKGYEYRARVINEYPWQKQLRELTAPDVIEFRSWLLKHYPRSMAHKVLSSFHSMIREMMVRGVLPHDVAAGISIREQSRYKEPVGDPVRAGGHGVACCCRQAGEFEEPPDAAHVGALSAHAVSRGGLRDASSGISRRADAQREGREASRFLARSSGVGKSPCPRRPPDRRFIDLSPERLQDGPPLREITTASQ